MLFSRYFYIVTSLGEGRGCIIIRVIGCQESSFYRQVLSLFPILPRWNRVRLTPNLLSCSFAIASPSAIAFHNLILHSILHSLANSRYPRFRRSQRDTVLENHPCSFPFLELPSFALPCNRSQTLAQNIRVSWGYP